MINILRLCFEFCFGLPRITMDWDDNDIKKARNEQVQAYEQQDTTISTTWKVAYEDAHKLFKYTNDNCIHMDNKVDTLIYKLLMILFLNVLLMIIYNGMMSLLLWPAFLVCIQGICWAKNAQSLCVINSISSIRDLMQLNVVDENEYYRLMCHTINFGRVQNQYVQKQKARRLMFAEMCLSVVLFLMLVIPIVIMWG